MAEEKDVRNFEEMTLLGELKQGHPLEGKVGDEDVVVFKVKDKVFAIGAHCSHYGAPLASGLVVGNTVRCPWHHAVFDLETGHAVGAPAFSSVGCYPVKVEGEHFRVLPKEEKESASSPVGVQGPESVVILGAGAAAAAAAELLRKEGYGGSITMVGEEEAGPVDRPNLSKDYLAGEAQEEWIPLGGDDHWRSLEVEVHSGEKVVEIERGKKEIRTASGKSFSYDVLLYATGAEPVVPPVKGLDGVDHFSLRSLADSEAILESLETSKRVLVVGASFIGLEVAASLRNQDVEVVVVAPENLPLARILGDEIGQFVKGVHEEKGVQFHLGQKLDRFEEGVAILSDGQKIEADFVVLATGVAPRVELAEAAGLEVDDGVVVDQNMKSSDGSIYAVGDVARTPDPIQGGTMRIEHWVQAQRLAERAVRAMLGVKQRQTYDVPFFWSRHFDHTIQYVGNGMGFDETRVVGDVSRGDGLVGYFKEGKVVAVATLGRDLENLQAEWAFEDGDQDKLKKILGVG